jgi:hypothetical protein
MKKFIVATLLAAFAFNGTGMGETPAPAVPAAPATNNLPEVKNITIEDLGQMLDAMGYSPRPGKNKEGKTIGYYVDLSSNGATITAYVTVGGTNVWIDTNCITYDEKNPATVPLLLGFLAEHDRLWPAYLNYYPKTKVMQLAQSVTGPVTSGALRKGLDSFMQKFLIVRDAYVKVKQIEKEEAEEKAAKELKTGGQ